MCFNGLFCDKGIPNEIDLSMLKNTNFDLRTTVLRSMIKRTLIFIRTLPKLLFFK